MIQSDEGAYKQRLKSITMDKTTLLLLGFVLRTIALYRKAAALDKEITICSESTPLSQHFRHVSMVGE